MKNQPIQTALSAAPVAIALCLLLHVGDRQILEDIKYALTVAQAVATQVQKRRGPATSFSCKDF